MNRRDLLRLLLAAPLAATVDVEQLLWTPKPIITVPAFTNPFDRLDPYWMFWSDSPLLKRLRSKEMVAFGGAKIQMPFFIDQDDAAL